MDQLKCLDDVKVALPIQVDEDKDNAQGSQQHLQTGSTPHHAALPCLHSNRHIRPGVSLLNSSVSQMLANTHTVRACAVKLVNYTRWKLESARIFVKGGHSISAQHDVDPLTAEAFVAEKTALTATGSYGTASFLVGGLTPTQFIHIMWSVSFDYTKFPNALGVEVSSDCGGPEDFDRMYYKPNSQEHSVTLEYYDNLVPLRVQTSELNISGTMGNGPKAEVLINVYEA